MYMIRIVFEFYLYYIRIITEFSINLVSIISIFSNRRVQPMYEKDQYETRLKPLAKQNCAPLV